MLDESFDVDANEYILDPNCLGAIAVGAQALRDHFSEAAKRGESYDVVTVKDRVIEPDLTRQTTPSSALPSSLRLCLPHLAIESQRERASKDVCTMYLGIPAFQGTMELQLARFKNQPFLHNLPVFLAVRILSLHHLAAKDFVEPPRFSTFARHFPALEIVRFQHVDCSDQVARPALSNGLTLKFSIAMRQTLVECDSSGMCNTWRCAEFDSCKNAEGLVDRIRADVRLQAFNARVQVVCTNSEGYTSADRAKAYDSDEKL